MDAKPTRGAFALPIRGDENKAPLAYNAIHQRHKSAGNMVNIMSSVNGTDKSAMKSNINNDTLDRAKSISSNDPSMPMTKNGTKISTESVAMGQENRAQVIAKDAFLRPAQRPPKSAVISAPMEQVGQAAVELKSKPEARPVSKLYNHARRGHPIVVYNDEPYKKEAQAATEPTPQQLGEVKAAAEVEHSKMTEDEMHAYHYPELQARAAEVPMEESLTMQEDVESNQDDGARLAAPQDGASSVIQFAEDITDLYQDALEEIPADRFPIPEPNTANGWEQGLSSRSEPDDTEAYYEPAAAKGEASYSQVHVYEDESTDSTEEEDYDDQGYATAHSGRDNTTYGATMVILPPKMTKKAVTEIEAAKKIVENQRAARPPHDDEEWDISMVTEYGEEIFEYMREVEMEMLPDPHYMDIQTEIQWSMRAVLLDWVHQVHGRFGLLPETLFLAVHFIDRFLAVKIVSIGKLQLVGATALLLAAKYEEINCPSIQEMIYMVDGCYSYQEIIKAERYMLTMLGYNLGWPGPMSFMRRISKADDYDNEIRTVAKYFLEVTLMDERFVASPPSYLAAGAQCLARMMVCAGEREWTPEHVYYSGYTYTQLKPLVAMILDCCRIADRHHRSVYNKYLAPLFKKASFFVMERIVRDGFKLPFQQTITFHVPSAYNGLYSAYPDSQPLTMPIPVLG
ncbi:cyclin-like protein [Hypoxylon sp. NC1633]|nr:cyclin-like protein [Hypoxylon sp. NC1633]